MLNRPRHVRPQVSRWWVLPLSLLFLRQLPDLPTSNAVTLVVDNLVDSASGVCVPDSTGGSCNIRAGVDYCLALGVTTLEDTCVLELASGTHVLTEGVMNVSSTVAISISGQGMNDNETVVFGGQNSGRWLVVEGSTVQFELSSLSVKGFRGSGVSGGGLFMTRTRDARLTRVRFEDNAVLGDGGAAYFLLSPGLQISACVWQNNRATDGGGGGIEVQRSDDVTFLNCSWYNNTADTNGGAMVVDESDRTVFWNCSWRNNTAEELGGAMLLQSATDSEFTDCTWVDNLAISGGAMYIVGSYTFGFRASVWQTNTALNGGGAVFLFRSRQNVFSNCTWFGNHAVAGAGALYASESGSDVFIRCLWRRNTAEGNGGAVIVSASPLYTFDECTWVDNFGSGCGGGTYILAAVHVNLLSTAWHNNSAEAGGALCLDTSNKNVLLSNTSWKYNTASETGGAVHLREHNFNVQILDCLAQYNAAGSSGGTIYAQNDNSDILLAGCTMSNNRAETGGAIASTYLSEPAWIDDSILTNNVAVYGGALALGLDDRWLVSNCTFQENYAFVQGGAMFVDDSEVVVITSTVVSDNHAQTSSAGGIAVTGDIICVVSDSVVAENTAASEGGGLFVESGSVYVTNSTLADNQASTSGGALYADTSALVQFGLIPVSVLLSLQGEFFNMSLNISQRGTVDVYGNRALGSGGGAYVSASTLVLLDVSLWENTALSGVAGSGSSGGGGGVALTTGGVARDSNGTWARNTAANGGALLVNDNAQAVLTATTLADNSASLSGGGLYADSQAAIDLRGAVVSGNTAKDSNGGGMYLRSSQNRFANVSVISNTAPNGGGGGLFWDWTTAVYVDTKNLTFTGNAAAYGESVATAIHNVTAPRTASAASGASIGSQSDLNVTAVDFYNQTVTSYESNYAQATAAAGPHCQAPKVSGSSVEYFAGGVADFRSLAVTCNPQSVALLTFTVVDAQMGRQFDAKTQLTLNQCDLGQIVAADVCETCGSGVYSWSNNASKCTLCLDHATCPASPGWQVAVDPGYWRHGTFSTLVRWCPNGDACEGGTNANDSQCLAGGSGPLCLVCEPGYYQTSGVSKCEPCDSGSRWAPIVVIAAIVLCVAAAGAWAYYHKHEWVAKFLKMRSRVAVRTHWKVLLAYVQIATQFHTIFSVSYPDTYTDVSSALNVANLGFSTVFAPHCYDSSYSYYDTLVFQTAGALGLVALGAAYYGARHFYARRVAATQFGPVADNPTNLRDRAFRAFIVFAYIVFPGTSTTIFQAFACDNDFKGGESYLKADYSISCNSDQYKSFVVYAAVMIVIFPVGIMSLYAYVLVTHRTRICPPLDTVFAAGVEVTGDKFARHWTNIHEHESLLSNVPHQDSRLGHERAVRESKRHLQYEYRNQDKSIRPIAFLFEAYRPEYWWMELVECFRRLMMSSILIFFWPASSTQIIMAMLICTFFLMLYSRLQPYMSSMANRLVNAVLWCVQIQLFVSLLLFQNLIASNTLAAFLLITALVVGPCVPFLLVVWSNWRMMSTARDRKSNLVLNAFRNALGLGLGLRETEMSMSKNAGTKTVHSRKHLADDEKDQEIVDDAEDVVVTRNPLGDRADERGGRGSEQEEEVQGEEL